MKGAIMNNIPKFSSRNVQISEISVAIGKSQQFIRVGLQKGILKFGYAYKIKSEKFTATIVPISLNRIFQGY